MMSERGVIPGRSGSRVRWFGGYTIVELPAGGGFLTPPALAGELCAVLDAGAAGLVNRPPPGNPRRLTPEQETELATLVEAGPTSAGLDHLARWRCIDLQGLIQARWGVRYHERTVGKLLDRLGFSHITTRPRHYRQDTAAMEAFKKTSPTRSRRSAPGSSPRHP